MSFYYLFLPTWVVTIIVYTLLAQRYGASKEYPEEMAEMASHDKLVEAYHEEQARVAMPIVEDTSLLSKALKSIAWISLIVTLALASITMFASENMAHYLENRETFYTYGFVCTILYFTAAYWALKRRKALQA